MFVCVRVCVCVRAAGWLQGSRGLPDRAGHLRPHCPRPPARRLLTWKRRFCLLQRERRIDTADGACAAASRPPLNVCVCARVAACSSPSPERKYSTEAEGTREEARQANGGRNHSLRGLTAPLAASKVGGMSNKKVGKCGSIPNTPLLHLAQSRSGGGGSRGLRWRRGAAPLRPHPRGLNVLDAKRARWRHSAPPMLARSGRCPGAASTRGTRRGALSAPLRASLGSRGRPPAARGRPRRCCPRPCRGSGRAMPRARGWGAAGAAGCSPGRRGAAAAAPGAAAAESAAAGRAGPPGRAPGPPGGLLAKFAGGRERGRRWLGRRRSSRAACCRRGSLLLCIEARPSAAKTPAAWRSLGPPLLPPALPASLPPSLALPPPLPCRPPPAAAPSLARSGWLGARGRHLDRRRAAGRGGRGHLPRAPRPPLPAPLRSPAGAFADTPWFPWPPRRQRYGAERDT